MRSRNGASGSRTGDNCRSPSAGGVHLSIMIPLGTSMKAIRIGRALSAASAGVIASSMGSASAAPAPRKNARRGMDFLVRTIVHSPHLKWRALDDAENHGRPLMVFRRGLGHDLAQRRTIVRLDAATQRIGHEAFGERVDEQGALAHQDIAQARRSV